MDLLFRIIFEQFNFGAKFCGNPLQRKWPNIFVFHLWTIALIVEWQSPNSLETIPNWWITAYVFPHWPCVNKHLNALCRQPVKASAKTFAAPGQLWSLCLHLPTFFFIAVFICFYFRLGFGKYKKKYNGSNLLWGRQFLFCFYYIPLMDTEETKDSLRKTMWSHQLCTDS